MASLFPSTRFEVLGATVRLWGGGCSGYAAAKNVERGSGMLIGVTPPDPRCAAPGKGSVQALYACLPERCPVPREGAVGGDARAGVPALQLRTLRGPGAHLSAITATCTAPGSAPVSAGASRLSGPRGGIREAAVVRGATPLGNVGGASGNDKNTTK